MKTDITDTSTYADREDLSPTMILTLLSDRRRRYTLHYLAQKVGAVPIGEVAEQIALWEDDTTRDRFERIVTGLCHVHLPKLTEAGVVRYDPGRETIKRLPPAEQLMPYLNLAIVDDLD